MRDPKLRAAVEASVVGLHDVFEDWLGDGSHGLDFGVVEQALAPGFVIVSPHGREQAREPLLDALRSARGVRPGLVIEARGTRVVRAAGPLVVARYEEWQHARSDEAAGDGAKRTWTVRLSTAVLEQAADVPWGFRWHWVQETWCAGRGPSPPG